MEQHIMADLLHQGRKVVFAVIKYITYLNTRNRN